MKPLVMYDVECRMALEPLQGNWASFPLDLLYTGLFRYPSLTSVSFYMCDSGLGDSLEFHQANQGSFHWEHRIALHIM